MDRSTWNVDTCVGVRVLVGLRYIAWLDDRQIHAQVHVLRHASFNSLSIDLGDLVFWLKGQRNPTWRHVRAEFSSAQIESKLIAVAVFWLESVLCDKGIGVKVLINLMLRMGSC